MLLFVLKCLCPLIYRKPPYIIHLGLSKYTQKIERISKKIKFKYSWRKYQQRVLNELENHLSDSHLHIIAPPGSGKTISGLEVALRLNKCRLILTE